MVMKYTEERGDFTVTGATWDTDGIPGCPPSAKITPHSEIKVLSKNRIHVMINGSLERKTRCRFELTVSGISEIFPKHDQCLAIMAMSDRKVVNLPVSCIVNENGLTITHDEAETDWYRIEGFLETIDYPIFHYQS
jgi:hypothetical protein